MPREVFAEVWNEQYGTHGIEGVAQQMGVSTLAASIRANDIFGFTVA